MITEYLLSQVMHYCERTDLSFWGEPANFLSNGAFLLAAAWLWMRARRVGLRRDPALQLLIGLIFLVGIGSGLFHSFATRLAQAGDVLPIALFVLAFLGIWLRQALRLPWRSVATAYGWFALLNGVCLALFRLGPIKVNGSEPYFASAIFLVGMGFWRRHQIRLNAPYLLYAGAVFGISIVLRGIDRIVCPYFPLGTHVGWHLGNAVVCMLLVTALIEVKAPTGLRSGSGENIHGP